MTRLPDLATLNGCSLPALFDHFASTGLLTRLLEIARDEDLGAERLDLTSASIPDDSDTTALLRIREPATIAGLAALPLIAGVYNATIRHAVHHADGDSVTGPTAICSLTGKRSELLAVERPLLNLVGRLTGIATLTRRYVDAVAGTRARILDTRKTTPGLRLFEKYAVRCGGGLNHRLALHDAVLIKDNHIADIPLDALPATVAAIAVNARRANPDFVQVEVDTIEQLGALLKLPAGTVDIVLLDNMDPQTLRTAASLRDDRNPSLLLEASGGVTLDTLREIAETGVDRISVGALTHAARSIDVGLDIDP